LLFVLAIHSIKSIIVDYDSQTVSLSGKSNWFRLDRNHCVCIQRVCCWVSWSLCLVHQLTAMNVLCYWGAQVREGFGLIQPDNVKHGKCGIRSVCSKTPVQDISAGRSFVGFIRNGKLWVLRLSGKDCDQDGKLSMKACNKWKYFIVIFKIIITILIKCKI